MKPTRLLLPIALTAAVLAADTPAQTTRPAAATRPERPTRADFERQYNVVIDNNIFLRERGRSTSRPSWTERSATQPATVPGAPAPSEEQSYALTGVVFEGSDLRAYFENLRDNTIVRVEPGETIAGGRIVEIAVDAVAYESRGNLAWIEIGHDLTGTTRVAATQPAAATQPTGTQTDPRLQSVEERMRANARRARGQ
jgi:hypothetical protein